MNKVHILLRSHPLFRNIRDPKEFASLFHDQNFDDGVEITSKRQRKPEPKPQPINTVAIKLVKAGLVSSRSSVLFSTLKSKPITDNQRSQSRSGKNVYERKDVKGGKHKCSRASKGSNKESSSLHEHEQQAQTNNISAVNSIIDDGRSGKGFSDFLVPAITNDDSLADACCPESSSNIASQLEAGKSAGFPGRCHSKSNLGESVSAHYSQESFNQCAAETAKEVPSPPVFDHLSHDERRTLILKIAQTLPLSSENLAGIAANLRIPSAGAESNE